MVPRRPLMFALIAGCLGITSTASAADQQDLIQLLKSRYCRDCQLSDVDLTHADLRDADLQRARLQRANLSQARLDGADLNGSDLSFTSLQGASLRGADLRNSRLMGTDLRRADLTGALLEQNALDQSHWNGARGVSQGARSHAGLHNAGVDAALVKGPKPNNSSTQRSKRIQRNPSAGRREVLAVVNKASMIPHEIWPMLPSYSPIKAT